jgi:hypothetical protein
MASNSIPDIKMINGVYSEGKGGWAELFEYGGIRYNALLRPSVDGRGVQDGLLRRLAKACEGDDDSIDDSSKVEGMLTELIPNAITLDHVDFIHFSKEQCNLWVSQIRSAIQYLHDKCLVWDDAKPANILIRPNNDLVLVDFAGGATEGWVDSKKINTQEGDIQALDRIEQFLQRKVVNGENNS